MSRDSHNRFTSRDRTREKQKRQRQFGMRDMVRRLSWLRDCAVYWAGPSDRVGEPLLPECRFSSEIIRERLSGCPRGLYAIELKAPEGSELLPEVRNVREVTGQHLADASWLLSRSPRHHKELQRLVGDESEWMDFAYQRLMLFSSAYQAAQLPHAEAPEALLIEAVCAWVGDESRRPSRILPTETLEQFLVESGEEDEDKTQWLAAVVLGQRQHGRVPTYLQPWRALGQLLSDWSPCILGQFNCDDCRKLTGLARQWPELNHWEWAEGLREYLFLVRDQVDPFELFKELPTVLACCRRLELEPRERLQALLECVGEALHETTAFVQLKAGKSYHWNHDFVIACKIKLAENLQMRDIPMYATNVDGGLQALCSWFLDIHLTDLAMMRLKKLQMQNDHDPNFLFLQKLQNILEEQLAVDSSQTRMTLAAAVGRISFVTSPNRTAGALAAWVDHCRRVCLPGKHGAGPLLLALRSLFNTFARIAPATDRDRILSIAGEHGRDILEELSARLGAKLRPPSCRELIVPLTQTKENHENLLLLLASIPEACEDYIPIIFEENLLGWLNQVARERPQSLDGAIGFLIDVDDEWYGLDSAERLSWSMVFRLESGGLAQRLAKWSLDHHKQGVAWSVLAQVLNDICRFLAQAKNPRLRQDFLWKNMDLLNKLFDFAVASSERAGGLPYWDVDVLVLYRMPLLCIAFHWHRQGYRSYKSVFSEMLAGAQFQDRRLLSKQLEPDLYVPEDADIELAVMLCAGNLDRLQLALNNNPQRTYPYPVQAATAWRFLNKHKGVQVFLSHLVDRPEEIVRIKTLLQRTALALRLQSSLALVSAFQEWQEPEPVSDAELPPDTPAAFRAELRELLAFRRMSGISNALPRSIRKILQRPASMKKEYEYLLSQPANPDTTARLRNLERYLADPDLMHASIEAKLKRELEKLLQLAKLSSLEAAVGRAIEQHWALLVQSDYSDDPDWENALLLCMSIAHNRRLLKELLRCTSSGDADWYKRHPVNQRFLNDIALNGVDPKLWLAEMEQQYTVHGQDWTVYVETNPLHALQMGNLFDTCLGVGGDSSYSTVANAIEVNKRLIYICNEKGHIIGRKLLAADRRGCVFGFNSYGKSDWSKILLDQFCRDFAQRCGAKLATADDVADLQEDSLRLFAKWYFDGVEPFDWWLYADDQKLHIQRHLEAGIVGDEQRASLLRALLTLGDEAVPVIRHIDTQLSANLLRSLRRETMSKIVRDFADGLLQQGR